MKTNQIDIHRKPRILLAEDHPTTRQVVYLHLKNAGFDVDTVENGMQAVDLCRHIRFDLIFMDIQMPGMDGLQASRAIRNLSLVVDNGVEPESSTATVPIIAMTGNEIEGERERCLAAGMDDHIVKPVLRAELLALIERYISDGSPKDNNISRAPMSLEDKDADQTLDFEKAVEEFDGDRELLKEVLTGFIENVREQIRQLQWALASSQMSLIRNTAHSIKGGAANLTAYNLARHAAELEKIAENGEPVLLREQLNRLENAFFQVETFNRNL